MMPGLIVTLHIAGYGLSILDLVLFADQVSFLNFLGIAFPLVIVLWGQTNLNRYWDQWSPGTTRQAGSGIGEVLVTLGGVLLLVTSLVGYRAESAQRETEARAAELNNLQAAMDAMMAHHRLLYVVQQNEPVDIFDELPIGARDSDGTAASPGEYEHLHPAFLRIGSTDNPTNMCYTWNSTGFVGQVPRDPATGRCPLPAPATKSAVKSTPLVSPTPVPRNPAEKPCCDGMAWRITSGL